MNAIHTISLLAAGLSLMVGTLHAAPRTCRLVFPERPQTSPKTAYLFDGAKSQKVTLPSMNLSEVIELPNGELALALVSDEIRDPKLLSPKAALLRIPEAVTEFYIVLTFDPDNKEFQVKMNLVDPGRERLGPGETLWFNFTGHRIVAKLGDADMSVGPKGRAVSRNPAPSSGYYTARFAYQAEGKGALAPITEQNWWHDSASRHLGFLVSTGGKLPRIYYFRDFRDPVPAEEAGG